LFRAESIEAEEQTCCFILAMTLQTKLLSLRTKEIYLRFVQGKQKYMNNNAPPNKSLDVRAKQQLSYRVVR